MHTSKTLTETRQNNLTEKDFWFSPLFVQKPVFVFRLVGSVHETQYCVLENRSKPSP